MYSDYSSVHDASSVHLSEDRYSMISPGITNDSAYSSTRTTPNDIQTPGPRGKKRVCFEPDHCLVQVIEIPYDRDEEPLPEEMEPCDPEKLIEEFDNLAINDIGTAGCGSYEVQKSPRKRREIVAQITDMDDIYSSVGDKSDKNRHSGNSRTSFLSSKGSSKSKRNSGASLFSHIERSSKRSPRHLQTITGLDYSKPRTSSSRKHAFDKNVSDHSSHKQKKGSKSSNPTHSGSSLGINSNKKDQSKVKPSKHSVKKADQATGGPIQDPASCREKSKEHSNQGLPGPPIIDLNPEPHVPIFHERTELRRPKSSPALPRLHLSPYRQFHPGYSSRSPRSMTFPDFISPRPLGNPRIGSADWGRCNSAEPENKRFKRVSISGPVSPRKVYSWQMANGILKPMGVETPCIAPMWDNMQARQLQHDTGSVTSAM